MDEYIAYVFVVDGSAFGLDDKLHRTMVRRHQTVKVTMAKDTLKCYFLLNYWPETQQIHDRLKALQKNLPNATLRVIVALFV